MSTEQRDIVVFLGPTIPRRDAQTLLDATYLAPVQQGAVLEVAQSGPAAIVLIDGYFSWVPSVWHKEILWALDQGIRVFGASSMGALRAAELHSFGMVGFGTVFEDFLHGRLEDDDEVAIVHADAEYDYRPMSDAMVNIRYTLATAEAHEVISRERASAFIGYCKEQVFYNRQFARLLADASREGVVSDEESERLGVWMSTNTRDVKREDAEGLLRLLADGLPEHESVRTNGFTFEPTANWLQLQASIRARRGIPRDANKVDPSERIGMDEVLTECRIAGEWPALEAMALARFLAVAPTFFARAVREDEYLTELARLCITLGLNDLDQLTSWLHSVGWNSNHLARLVEREALLEQARQAYGDDLREAIAEVLVLTRRTEDFADRALRKRRWLELGVHATDLAADPTEAIAGFREKVGAAPTVPNDVLARKHGWPSPADMAEDLLRDYEYSRAAKMAK